MIKEWVYLECIPWIIKGPMLIEDLFTLKITCCKSCHSKRGHYTPSIRYLGTMSYKVCCKISKVCIKEIHMRPRGH